MRHDLLSPIVLGGLLGTAWRFDGVGVLAGALCAAAVALALIAFRPWSALKRWRSRNRHDYASIRAKQQSAPYRITYAGGIDLRQSSNGYGVARSK
jgi:hypothetical protein